MRLEVLRKALKQSQTTCTMKYSSKTLQMKEDAIVVQKLTWQCKMLEAYNKIQRGGSRIREPSETRVLGICL